MTEFSKKPELTLIRHPMGDEHPFDFPKDVGNIDDYDALKNMLLGQAMDGLNTTAEILGHYRTEILRKFLEDPFIRTNYPAIEQEINTMIKERIKLSK